MSSAPREAQPRRSLWRREWQALRGFGRLLRTREAFVILSGALLLIGYELHKADAPALYEALFRRRLLGAQLHYVHFFGWQAASTLFTGLVPLVICLVARWPLGEMGLGPGRPRVWAPYLGAMLGLMAVGWGVGKLWEGRRFGHR